MVEQRATLTLRSHITSTIQLNAARAYCATCQNTKPARFRQGVIPPAKRHPTAFLLYYACIDGPHLVPEGLVFLLSAGLPMRGPAHPFQPYCGT